MALADILKLLTKPAKQQSAADLRAALAQIDVPALERKVDQLEAERRRLLVHGSDAEILAIGQGIAAANLACERGSAAADELKAMIVSAEERETADQIEEQAAEAQRAEQQLAATYRAIDDHAEKVKALLAEATSAAGRLAHWNRRTEKIGAPHRRIAYTEPLAAKQRLQGALR